MLGITSFVRDMAAEKAAAKKRRSAHAARSAPAVASRASGRLSKKPVVRRAAFRPYSLGASLARPLVCGLCAARYWHERARLASLKRGASLVPK